ncbi:MAG: tRNA 2-thiouridine(34) synthase MnmA [Candidatus Eisenbacteria bacterium]|nr:tRNA 2-thiouridine(34) synthase MnmA [Candidatus Eisenbacteria bacterium]
MPRDRSDAPASAGVDQPTSRRVLVAMSGGVDSAVAAARLQQAGWEVGGVTFKLFCYGDTASGAKACCGLEGVRDAQATARRLSIPHIVMDLSDLFREKVYDDFAREYAAGRTPNPCVQCNTHVKFAPLLSWARRQGYEYIATGHYARVREHRIGARSYRLIERARSDEKDQSYVLWGVPAPVLDRCLFPLGESVKPEVRREARDRELPVWDKGDSQDICFVDDRGYAEVLRATLGADHAVFRPGEIRDDRERVLGRHQGLAHYTVGQRRGLGLGGGEALHVVALETDRNVLRVGPDRQLERNGLWASDLNLFVEPEHLTTGPVEVKIRYRHEPAAAEVRLESGRLHVRFQEAQRSIAPGQSCVVYRDGLLLGGGRIDSVCQCCGDPGPYED